MKEVLDELKADNLYVDFEDENATEDSEKEEQKKDVGKKRKAEVDL